MLEKNESSFPVTDVRRTIESEALCVPDSPSTVMDVTSQPSSDKNDIDFLRDEETSTREPLSERFQTQTVE